LYRGYKNKKLEKRRGEREPLVRGGGRAIGRRDLGGLLPSESKLKGGSSKIRRELGRTCHVEGRKITV